MKNIFLITLSFLALSSYAQEITINQTRTIDFNKEYVFTYNNLESGLAIDSEGSKIIVGTYDGVHVDFGDADTMSSHNNSNIFIAKYDRDNKLVFSKNIGSGIEIWGDRMHDYATDVQLDNENNIYVLATINVSTTDTVDLDPQHPESNSIITTNIEGETSTYGGKDVFIIKYSPNGTFLWTKHISDGIADTGLKLYVDQNNGVWATGYISGFTSDSIDFDAENTYADNRDLIEGELQRLGFVAHYKSNGDFIDVKGIGGGTLSDIEISVSQSGNMYITGSFCANGNTENNRLSVFKNSESPKFITSQGSYDFSPENEDIFIIKCKPAGEVEWIKTISSPSKNRVSDMVINSDENIYVSGFFTGTDVDFDSDNEIIDDKRTSTSDGSGFIAGYDSEGNLLMVKTIEGGARTRISCLDVREDGVIAVGGAFIGNISLDTIDANSTETSAFVGLIDPAGKWRNAKTVEKNKEASIENIQFTESDGIEYVGFEFSLVNENTYNAQSIFMGKILTSSQNSEPNRKTLIETACGSYTSPSGKIFDESGSYIDSVFSETTDTIYTIQLTINNLIAEASSDNNVLTANIPDSHYQWIDCNSGKRIEDAVSRTYTPNGSGSYAVIIDDGICIDTSRCVSFFPTSILTADSENGVLLFPSPIANVVNIETEFSIKTINIYHANGILWNSFGSMNSIDLSNLPTGFYLMKIQLTNNTAILKYFLKE